MLITTSEGIPYPLAGDFSAIPNHIQALALSLDGLLPTWDAGYQAVVKTPSFLLRASGAGAAVTIGNSAQLPVDTTVFANAGALVSNNYQQAASDVPSWWLVGCYIALTNGGTVTANTINKVAIAATYSWGGSTFTPGPPISSVVVANPATPTGAIYGEQTETNNGGEVVQAVGVIKLFGAATVIARYVHTDTGAGATRASLAGSALWGMRLGNV